MLDYVNRSEGFRTSLRKEEYVEECSDIDDVIVFKKGNMIVTRVENNSLLRRELNMLLYSRKKIQEPFIT